MTLFNQQKQTNKPPRFIARVYFAPNSRNGKQDKGFGWPINNGGLGGGVETFATARKAINAAEKYIKAFGIQGATAKAFDNDTGEEVAKYAGLPPRYTVDINDGSRSLLGWWGTYQKAVANAEMSYTARKHGYTICRAGEPWTQEQEAALNN